MSLQAHLCVCVCLSVRVFVWQPNIELFKDVDFSETWNKQVKVFVLFMDSLTYVLEQLADIKGQKRMEEERGRQVDRERECLWL